jgi:flavorubredoxin
MNTQEFILKLAEQLGADAKTVVVLVVLVAPTINWLGALSALGVVGKIIYSCIKLNGAYAAQSKVVDHSISQIVRKLSAYCKISNPYWPREFQEMEVKLDELLKK